MASGDRFGSLKSRSSRLPPENSEKFTGRIYSGQAHVRVESRSSDIVRQIESCSLQISREELPHVVIIPGRPLAVGTQAGFGGSVLANQIKGDLAQEREVADSAGITDAAVILPEGDIQHPVQIVLDRPMATNGLGQHRRLG